MSPYFVAITFINLFTLLMLSICIMTNTVISRSQKTSFLLTNAMIFVICVMEVLTIMLDGSPAKYRWIHILSNYLGFSLTPLVFLFLGNALIPEKKLKWLLGIWVLYSGWIIISLAAGKGHSIFYIDGANRYHRAKGFILYVIFYAFGLTYFFIENVRLSLKFWRMNSIILILTFTFVMVGTTIQIINPQIQVTWLCVVISVVIYYIYHDTLFQQLDIQTYLMNYNSFQKWLKSQRKDAVIVIAEIDNFSKLKLNYNRSRLDGIVVSISRNFNDYFKKFGRCYRIGSEEFCAVIHDTSLDYDELCRNFFVGFVKLNFDRDGMPLISLGHARLSPNADINQVLSCADIKKRDFIRERISYLY